MGNLYITKRLLLEDGKLVGFRFYVTMYGRKIPTLTRDISAEDDLEELHIVKPLKILGADIVTEKPLKCYVEEDCFVVDNKSGIEVLKDTLQCSSYLDKLGKLYSQYNKFRAFMENFVYSLKMELQYQGVQDALEEIYNYNTLCYSVRFLGGKDAWSSVSDIGYTLDSKVKETIVKSVKIRNNYPRYGCQIELVFEEENAWLHFYFMSDSCKCEL